jgi:hypothetical protein
MGIEYRLRFAAPDAETVAAELRRLPAAREVPAQAHRFDLGLGAADLPQATVQAEPGGAYFCDHCGGTGRALLGEVVARLVTAFGPVSVEEV